MLVRICSALLAAAAFAIGAPPTDEASPAPEPTSVSAPVVYKDLMLVLSSDDGVGAIVFTDPIKDGTGYKFRYESQDGQTKLEGAGQVFEKYRRDPGQPAIVNEGGELHLKAGPIHVEWSLGGEKSGWIYYDPDLIRVQIVSAKHFEKLDLKRFVK